MAIVEELLKTQGCINVFGYGSLIWKPDFEYDQSYLGYIDGYERRFWQGSTHHRGTVEKPGRVLTLSKVEKGRCWGRVFVINGQEKIRKALDYLQTREQSLGHYDISVVPVNVKELEEKVYSVVYYATPKNPLFLGDAPIDKLAEDIVTSRGAVGHNIEYLLRLTDFMRERLARESDEHLYNLDRLVRVKIGLHSTNVLPWTKLLQVAMFRNIIFCEQRQQRTSESDEETSPIIVKV